jgi:hypothetical protein
MPDKIPEEKILFSSSGYFLGGNISQNIERIIYIDPHKYIALLATDKHEVARIIGRLNKSIGSKEKLPTILMGPGRWGTTTPSLGVPVSFSEINNVTVLTEVAFPEGNLMPELSFGTHFFQDLVETNIFYTAIFHDKEDSIFNNSLFLSFKDSFKQILPQSAKYNDVIKVYETGDKKLMITSDVVLQKVLCFLT